MLLKQPLIALSVLLLLDLTVSCGSDNRSSTTYGGTYTVTDEFGAGSGTVSFTVENNNTLFCFVFSGKESEYSTACKNPATDSFPININQFSIPFTTDRGTYTLEGQFPDLVHATGNVVGPSGAPLLTWTATAEGDDD